MSAVKPVLSYIDPMASRAKFSSTASLRFSFSLSQSTEPKTVLIVIFVLDITY
jgi:hypothetical protein